MSIHVRPQSLTKGRCRALRLSIPIEPQASPRACLEAQIEFLIGMLDRIDGDTDLEPSLGTSYGRTATAYVDREGDDCDLEYGGDSEPSLGWPDRMVNQEHLEPRCLNAASDLELDRSDYEDGEAGWPNPLGAVVDRRGRLTVERVPDRQVSP